MCNWHLCIPLLFRRDIGVRVCASYTSEPPSLSRFDIGALVFATYASESPLFCFVWTSGLMSVRLTFLYLPSFVSVQTKLKQGATHKRSCSQHQGTTHWAFMFSHQARINLCTHVDMKTDKLSEYKQKATHKRSCSQHTVWIMLV